MNHLTYQNFQNNWTVNRNLLTFTSMPIVSKLISIGASALITKVLVYTSMRAVSIVVIAFIKI